MLATIVNTIGFEKGLGGDKVTQRNIKAAAREELIHYDVLHSVGGRAVGFKIWIPDAVSPTAQLPQHPSGRRPDLRQRLPDRDRGVRKSATGIRGNFTLEPGRIRPRSPSTAQLWLPEED